MNIAIVDDSQNEIDSISALVRDYAAVGKLPLSLSVFRCAEDFLENYSPYAYTVIFMDIYMTGMTGVEAAKEILDRDRHAMIIFLTSSDEHMPEAFSMHVFDYIPKPADKDRVFKALDDLLLKSTDADPSARLTFLCEKMEISLPISDIVCIQTSEKNYLEITDISGNKYTTRMTISEISDRLEGDTRFLSVIRGVLVNMEFIKTLDKNGCLLTTGASLPINIKNSKKIRTAWQNYVFDNIRADRRERRSRK